MSTDQVKKYSSIWKASSSAYDFTDDEGENKTVIIRRSAEEMSDLFIINERIYLIDEDDVRELAGYTLIEIMKHKEEDGVRVEIISDHPALIGMNSTVSYYQHCSTYIDALCEIFEHFMLDYYMHYYKPEHKFDM